MARPSMLNEGNPVRVAGKLNGTRRQRRVRQLILRDAVLLCWVCGEPIDADAPENDPGQLTLDHVIPRRLGGGHELENLRLAHKACNKQRDRDSRSQAVASAA